MKLKLKLKQIQNIRNQEKVRTQLRRKYHPNERDSMLLNKEAISTWRKWEYELK